MLESLDKEGLKIENEPLKYKENRTLSQSPPYLYLASVYMNLSYYLPSETRSVVS